MLADHGPRSRAVMAIEATLSTAFGIRLPAGSASEKRACVQARSASTSSHGSGMYRLFHSMPRRVLGRLASVAPASPT